MIKKHLMINKIYAQRYGLYQKFNIIFWSLGIQKGIAVDRHKSNDCKSFAQMCIFTMYNLVTITYIIYPCSCQNAPMCNTGNHSYQLEDQRG